MKKLLFVISFAFAGCGTVNQAETLSLKVCDCEQKKLVTSFIQNSIKNGNNMSDEEMEDVINQLEYTGVRTICADKAIQFRGCGYGCLNEIITPLDSCESVYFY